MIIGSRATLGSAQSAWMAGTLLVFAYASHARLMPKVSTKRFQEMTPGQIDSTLHSIGKNDPRLRDRINAVSSYFLGMPYAAGPLPGGAGSPNIIGPLGEGPRGEFDRNPIVSFQALDCTTFVEEAMAFSLQPDLAKGTTLLQKIRYKNGVISYQTRNHFPSVDWIPNNIAAGFIKDITRDIAGSQTRTAIKTISKRAWYAAKTAANLQGFDNLSPAQKDALVAKWRSLGANMPDEKASLPYLPIELLPQYLNSIPSGTIANLVRADDPTKVVLVSHQVLIIDENGQKYVRMAIAGKGVADMPALQYFQIYRSFKWPLLGLNLNEVLLLARP